MRRRRPGRDSFSISLFPFLAVLICTFGVLIVLLVLVVKAADQQAAQVGVAETEEIKQQMRQLQEQLDTHRLQVQGLQQLRPELVRQLQEARSRRADLQSEIDQLAGEAELINQQARLLENAPLQSPLADLEAEIADLKTTLAAGEAELQRLRSSEASKRPVKYCVVPHDGPDGTRRRPVYIECLQDQFVIQPYGISLSPGDFVEPIMANNPLDAALVAVREYFLENRIVDAGETPYPLLIVRPEGAASYVVARHAIKSWDEEFGYELISADKDLHYGTADPLLKKKISSAVEAAKQRQQQYVANRLLNREARTSQPIQRGGLQASRRLGGFVSQSGLPAGKRNDESPTDSNPGRTKSSPASEKVINPGDAEKAPDIAVNGLQGQAGSLAEERGKDWAVPLKTQGSMAYRRPVSLVISQQEIVMESDSRSNKTLRIPFSSTPAATAEELVEAIWQRIDTWGVAGVGGHWQPELIVKVAPNGHARYRQLKTLLDESGIDIRERGQ